jgi:hypothetical protein
MALFHQLNRGQRNDYWPRRCAPISTRSGESGGSMKTEGIDGILIETHNWGKTVVFW